MKILEHIQKWNKRRKNGCGDVLFGEQFIRDNKGDYTPCPVCGSKYCEKATGQEPKKPITRDVTPEAGFRLLANWFDRHYGDAGINDQVQRDLRRWAIEWEEMADRLFHAENPTPK